MSKTRKLGRDDRHASEAAGEAAHYVTVKYLVDECNLGFPSEKACRDWLQRHLIPIGRRGRVIVVNMRDIEDALWAIRLKRKNPTRLKRV